ncbi:hypothetical protein [Acinetobacter ursingii]|uniref:hypothetical protein n=1 Tax=Acinetobacter ursingii TaxID=108980 RepID=UPI00300BE9A0
MTENKQNDVISQLSNMLSDDYNHMQENYHENHREVLKSYLIDVPESLEFSSTNGWRFVGPFLTLMFLGVCIFFFFDGSMIWGVIFLILTLWHAFKTYKNWNACKTVFMRLTREKLILDGLLISPLNLVDIDEFRIKYKPRPTLILILKENTLDIPQIKNKSEGCNRIKIEHSGQMPPVITITMECGVALNGKGLIPQELSDIFYTQIRAALAYQQLHQEQ